MKGDRETKGVVCEALASGLGTKTEVSGRWAESQDATGRHSTAEVPQGAVRKGGTWNLHTERRTSRARSTKDSASHP